MKRIIFITGTRADFGKLKSLIKISQCNSSFDVHVFVTGMHLDKKYGETILEIEKSDVHNIHKYKNYQGPDYMDRTLASTILGFSKVVEEIKPDLIVVHGDRVEPLAGAIVGSLNNILVSHIEGGEVSGTVDELIRHAVSKLSHIHLVSNDDAKRRLIQMGEIQDSVYVIGSPDIDLMDESHLPTLEEVKKHYGIPFNNFAIVLYHSVTTELADSKRNANNIVDAILKSKNNFLVIYPNNDLGCDEIFKAYKLLENKPNIKIFPSLRFEYFLRALKESKFILGNSSAGVREAPYYNVPTVNIGTRQSNRVKYNSIINAGYSTKEISEALSKIEELETNQKSFTDFGTGNSDRRFLKLILSDVFWKTERQKQFQDL